MQIAHKHHRGHAMGSLILASEGLMSLSYRVYHSFTIRIYSGLGRHRTKLHEWSLHFALLLLIVILQK
jgi:hypothetical protein